MKVIKGAPSLITILLLTGLNIGFVHIIIFTIEEFSFSLLLFLIAVEVLLYLIFGDDKNYFIIHKDKIEVKNDWYFWRQDVYKFDNCEKIHFYAFPRVRFMLTIDTKDKKRKGYVSNISSSQIDALRETFGEYGMRVEERH
jgi:hypothetical protein